MRELGCTYGQGYFFAKPASEAEIEAGVEGLATPRRWQPKKPVRGRRGRERQTRRLLVDQPA